MKWVIMLFFVFIFTTITSGQLLPDKWYEGYVVPNDLDTVFGNINFNYYKDNVLIIDSNSKEWGFGTHNTKYFVVYGIKIGRRVFTPLDIVTDEYFQKKVKKFFEVLVIGEINLLRTMGSVGEIEHSTDPNRFYETYIYYLFHRDSIKRVKTTGIDKRIFKLMNGVSKKEIKAKKKLYRKKFNRKYGQDNTKLQIGVQLLHWYNGMLDNNYFDRMIEQKL